MVFSIIDYNFSSISGVEQYEGDCEAIGLATCRRQYKIYSEQRLCLLSVWISGITQPTVHLNVPSRHPYPARINSMSVPYQYLVPVGFRMRSPLPQHIWPCLPVILLFVS